LGRTIFALASAEASPVWLQQHKQRRILLSTQKFFLKLEMFLLSLLTLAAATRVAIKKDINFFLDFDFQPLYTFINCGFLFGTADP
jgi:hypothetical protein